jgi:phosphatidylinositol-bisphosphatase
LHIRAVVYETRITKQSIEFLELFQQALKESIPMDISLLQEYNLVEKPIQVIPRTSSLQETIKQNPFILPNLNPLVHDIKKVRDNWMAKELRSINKEYSQFEPLQLFCASWNVAGIDPVPVHVWIDNVPERKDVYVFGFQEIDMTTEAYLYVDTTKELAWIHMIEKALPNYQLVASKQLVGMLLLVFIKKELFGFVSQVSTEYIGSGMLGMMGNKGAVGIRFRYKDSFYTFVNSHLAADINNTERRNQDYQYISKRLVFPLSNEYHDSQQYYQKHPWVSRFLDHVPSLHGTIPPTNATFSAPTNSKCLSLFDTDHLIWIGDLNYRVLLSESETKKWIQEKQFTKLMEYDQVCFI